MNKGIVMEMTDKSIIVMRQDGKFDRISRRNRSCEIGEEIIYADAGVNWRSPSVAGRSAVVAAVVFCLVVFASFAGKMGSSEVVAYVSLDINPSIEMGIDEKEQVLELRGLNDDGSDLIQAIDYKGKPMESVTASLLDKAEQKSLAKGEADIVIASSVVNANAKLNDEQIAEKLRQQVTNHIKTTHPDQVSSYQVEAFAAPQEVREEASKTGVSMGKYSVYLNAKSNGVPITIDDLKKESVHQFVKEHQDSKDDIVQPAKMPNKDTFKKLVEEEKSGELDKKLEEKKKEKSNKDNSKGNSNGRNNPIKPGSGTTGSTGSTNSSNNSKDKKDDNKKDDNKKDDDKKDNDKKDNGRFPSKPNIPSSGHIMPGGSKPGVTAPGNARPGSNKDDDSDDDNKKSDGRGDDDNRNDPRKNDNKQNDADKDDGRKNDSQKNESNQNNQKNDNSKNDNKKDNGKKDDDKQDNDKQDSNKQDGKRTDNSNKDDQKNDSNRSRQQDKDNKSSDDRKKDEAVQNVEQKTKTKAPVQAADTDRLHIFDWFRKS